MANITSPRDAKLESPVDKFRDPLAAATKLLKGGAVLVNASGHLVKAASGVTGTCRGVMDETVDNTAGAAGDLSGDVRSGVVQFHIDAGDPVTIADLEKVVFFLDDQTISRTSNSGARPAAGRLKRIPAVGKASVACGSLFSTDGDLLAANNLSDVAAVATARANIGANKGELYCYLPSLVAGVHYFPLPENKAITIVGLRSTINGALLTADLTITAAINTTNITNGVITVTQAGSAAGDQDEAAPSAANVSDGANDSLRLTLAGNTAAVAGCVLVEFTW